MPSDLQVSNIKDLTGSNTGLSIASDGQVTISQNNPTIQLGSNATFPTKITDKTYFYPSSTGVSSSDSYGNFVSAGFVNNGSIRTTIAVPTQFSSVQSMHYCWFPDATDNYTLRLQANSISNGEAYNANALSVTTLLSGASRTASNISIDSILSVSAINTFMTTNLTGGDLLGIRVFHDTSQNQYALGFRITWSY